MIGLQTQQARDELLKAQQRRAAGTPGHEAAAAAQAEHGRDRGSMEYDDADDDGQETAAAEKSAALGHPFGDHPQLPAFDHMGCQPGMTPAPGPVVTAVSGGALASSVGATPQVAALRRYDAAAPASPDLAGQLGMRAPSGLPQRTAPHIAPTGPTATPRGSGVAGVMLGSGQ